MERLNMSDQLPRDMGDGSPRDASKMGSNSHTMLYTVAAACAAVILIAAFGGYFAATDDRPLPPQTTTR
jgi:hypothetical protein